MRLFKNEALWEIYKWLSATVKNQPAGAIVKFEVLNPDLAQDKYTGASVSLNGFFLGTIATKPWSPWLKRLTAECSHPNPPVITSRFNF